MNPNTRPDENDARLTALLLGELSPDEAADLRAQMSAEPELTALHGRLQRAVELVRAATALADDSALPPPAALSHERRERLLASFKNPAPAPASEIVPPLRRDWKWLVPLGLAAALIALLGGTVLMNDFSFSQRKNLAQEAPDFAAVESSRVTDKISARDRSRDRADAPAPVGATLASAAPLRMIAEAKATPQAAQIAGIPVVRNDAGANAAAARGSVVKDVYSNESRRVLTLNSGTSVVAPMGAVSVSDTSDMNGPVSRIEPPRPIFSGTFGNTGRDAAPQFQSETSAGATGNKPIDTLLAGTNSFDRSEPINGGETLTLSGSVQQLTKSGSGSLNLANTDDALEKDKLASAEKPARMMFDRGAITSKPIGAFDDVGQLELPLVSKAIDRDGFAKQEEMRSRAAGSESVAVPPEKAAEQDAATRKKEPDAAEPQPEVLTTANAFSTFSLNVSDVSFKLAAASLEQGKMPEPATVRSEEFINAFDYRDPEPSAGAPLGFVSERARYPFAQNRDLLRLSVKTAAAGREPGRPLNLVLLLDNSGSMERADRVAILREALRVLSAQLQPRDKLSVVTFARTPRLWADGVAGDQAAAVTARVGEITPQGGTDLAAALDLGYATALRHFAAGSINRVVLLTDGAANLGDVNPDALEKKVEAHRQQGVALDCFGIGWEGYDDTLLETLSRHGDGRYGFLNTPEEAATGFATQLAGALRVAASDVKVQVEWNPRRVTAYRQIGYAKHQLTKEQFRDNTVDAAEIGAAESGNALYVVEVNPRGEGDLATVRVRFKAPGTDDYREHEWTVPFTREAAPLEQASPALRLAGTASAFSEWLVASPYASEVTPDRLLALLSGVPAIYGADPRPQKLEWMIRTAKSVSRR